MIVMFGFRRDKQRKNRFFDFRRWSNYDRIASDYKNLAGHIKQVFQPRKERYNEDFAEAVARLGLSEHELARRQQGLLRLVVIMLGVALGTLIYLIYLLWTAYYAAALVAATMMMLALTLAFRYHFWYYQMKQQRLGCTVNEWFSALITRKTE